MENWRIKYDDEQIITYENYIVRYQNKINELIDKNNRRPWRVYTRTKHTHWNNFNHWYRTSRSSFKYEKEAIRRAAKLRLSNVECAIRKWDNNDKVWRTL